MKRKGAFDAQLNWVFVLVAGAVILTFFFAAIQKQKEFSERKVSESLNVGFEGIFTGAQAASDTAFTMSIPEEGVSFVCTNECDCRFSVGRANAPFDDKLLFGKSHIPGPEMTLYALDFKLPFRAATMVFATSKQIQYVFVSDNLDNPIKEKIKELWPKDVAYQEMRSDQLLTVLQNNNEETAFVFFDQTISDLSLDESFIGEKASGVHIIQSGNIYMVQFLRKFERGATLVEDGSQLLAPNEASVIAAIVSADRDMYSCNEKTIYTRLNTIAEIYKDRAQALENNQQTPAECDYLAAQAILDRLATWSNAARATIPISVDQELRSILESLNQENRKLLDQSCPLLY